MTKLKHCWIDACSFGSYVTVFQIHICENIFCRAREENVENMVIKVTKAIR